MTTLFERLSRREAAPIKSVRRITIVSKPAPDRSRGNHRPAFLGLRLTCARCHKHPFDRWTTDDYWNFAAFKRQGGDRAMANCIGNA